jgi:hypothetical protein
MKMMPSSSYKAGSCIRTITGFIMVLIACATDSGAAQAGDKDSVTQGVPATIELWNAVPNSEMTLTLTPGTCFLSVEPPRPDAPWLQYVKTNGGTMTIKLPPDALPDTAYPTLRIKVGLELDRDAGGRVSLKKPLVFALHSPYGSATLQEGSFRLNVSGPPPTCTVSGCRAHVGCPAGGPTGDSPRGCYNYYGTFYCCVVSPYPN